MRPPRALLEARPAAPMSRVLPAAGVEAVERLTARGNRFPRQLDKAAEAFAVLKYHYRYRPGEDQRYPPQAAMADFPAPMRWLWRGYKAGL
jgi:hypothetical protein